MRYAAAIIGLVLTIAAARADRPPLSAFDIPCAAVDECDPPDRLPPLLAVPPNQMPAKGGPAGPRGEYDPGYFYLPERSPEPAKPAACGPAGRFWIGPGLELAWIKAPTAPPLLHADSATGPLLYGNERINSPLKAGFSLNGGLWLNEEHTRGVDASFLAVSGFGSNSVIFPDGDPPLVLPAGGFAFPLNDMSRGYGGAFQAGLSTTFTTADVNYRQNLYCTGNTRLDALVGYRFAHLGDDYEVYGKRLGPDGEIVRFRDEAHTRTNFHGGQIGLAGEARSDRWFVTGSGKIAFGESYSDAEFEGKFRLNGTVAPFGLYARPGLRGTTSASQFAVMPAAAVTLGRQLGDHARVSVGYTFLYLNRVARGPDVFATALTPALVRSDVETTDVWLQSVNLSFELRY
jgi:hypothetical protein